MLVAFATILFSKECTQTHVSSVYEKSFGDFLFKLNKKLPSADFLFFENRTTF